MVFQRGGASKFLVLDFLNNYDEPNLSATVDVTLDSRIIEVRFLKNFCAPFLFSLSIYGSSLKGSDPTINASSELYCERFQSRLPRFLNVANYTSLVFSKSLSGFNSEALSSVTSSCSYYYSLGKSLLFFSEKMFQDRKPRNSTGPLLSLISSSEAYCQNGPGVYSSQLSFSRKSVICDDARAFSKLMGANLSLSA